jgi:hypothetical protein
MRNIENKKCKKKSFLSLSTANYDTKVCKNFFELLAGVAEQSKK